MKLKLKGYVLKRCDTNEYLRELVVSGSLGIATWTDLDTNAGLFNSKYEAIVVGNAIANTIKIKVKFRQVFKFEQDYLLSSVS